MTKLLHTNKLLASIAVFADLCNTEKDLKSILTEFVKSVFTIEKKFSMDSNEVTKLITNHYGFELPEAVIRTCLNNLVSNDLAEKISGKYFVQDDKVQTQDLNRRLEEKKELQLQIEKELIEYVNEVTSENLDNDEKKVIIDGFISYLMDNGVSDKYSAIISAFVIDKSSSEKFVSELSQIKEGLVLITGLSYTSELNQIELWDKDLTIFLDAEHLFNSAGFNGEVFKRIFNDFYNLVSEVNLAHNRKKGKRLIHLKYFKDVKEDIDAFFHAAQRIVKREDSTSPQNIAMQTICNGCSNVSDVLRRKAEFERALITMGISEQEEFQYYQKPEFIVEDQQLIEKYVSKFPDDQIAEALRGFTKINYLRKGINRTSFEKCGFITMTGKWISLILSRDLEIKNEAKDIPFVTDIYFLTNRIWYKLNKGLNSSPTLPATLDIVVKAQIVLSAQVNKTIEKEYENLKKQVKTGKLKKDDAEVWYNSLREQSKKPEEITTSNVEKSIELIFDNDFEKYIKEQSELKEEARKGREAIEELQSIKTSQKQAVKKTAKAKVKNKIIVFIVLLVVFGALLIASTISLICYLKSDSDTVLSVIGLLITLVIEGFGLFKVAKYLEKKYRKNAIKRYVNAIRN